MKDEHSKSERVEPTPEQKAERDKLKHVPLSVAALKAIERLRLTKS